MFIDVILVQSERSVPIKEEKKSECVLDALDVPNRVFVRAICHV